MTLRLLKRSARKPPVMENKMNGTANNMPTIVTSRSRCPVGRSNCVIRKMASHLSALSLNAPWNCVTISAQKPRNAEGGAQSAAGFPVSFTAQPYQEARPTVN